MQYIQLNDGLILLHNSGFFSCCSVRLYHIINYFNTNNKLPIAVDSSYQFAWYKPNGGSLDITFDYFKNYNDINIEREDFNFIDKHLASENHSLSVINYDYEHQHRNYHLFNYKLTDPFVKKYFSPSQEILDIIKNLEVKYKIDYDNTCAVFYRGNDKKKETKICEYVDYEPVIDSIVSSTKNIKLLIQSDETEFIETMTKKYINSFYMNDEIRHMKRCNSVVDLVFKNQNYIYSKYFLAIIIIMSKCKYIVCNSCNGSSWMMLYRSHTQNVYQNLNNVWYS